MNPYDAPKAPIQTESEQGVREAPSRVYTACRKLTPWMLTLSILFAAFAVVAIWIGFEITEAGRMAGEIIEGDKASGFYPEGAVAWVLAALFAANAVAAFRYFQGLRIFSRDRRVVVLYAAMCRMRAFVRIFGLSLVLGAIATAAVVGAAMIAPRGDELGGVVWHPPNKWLLRMDSHHDVRCNRPAGCFTSQRNVIGGRRMEDCRFDPVCRYDPFSGGEFSILNPPSSM
jgi:hypothetical protein